MTNILTFLLATFLNLFLECVPYAFEITGRLSPSRRYPHVSNEKFTAENAELMMQLENLILPSME